MDEEITADELKRLLDEDADVRVVDIRDPASFERGHIPDSENIPFAEIPNRVEELSGADRVVTVCPIGQSSIQAARLIGSFEGVDGPVESLAEGLEGWEYGFESGRGERGNDERGGERADGESGSDRETVADEGPEAPF